MTPDELDRRVKDIAEEAYRIMDTPGTHPTMAEIAARLALTGWEKPDPLLQIAREVCAEPYPPETHFHQHIMAGSYDDLDSIKSVIRGIRRGYELGKEAAR